MTLRSTLMSDVRTAVSLIGFGFTVAQFFRQILGNATGIDVHINPNLPRNVGLLLIAVGIGSLAMGTWTYHHDRMYLQGSRFARIAVHRPFPLGSYAVALAVILIGVLAFLSVLYRF